MTQLSANVGYKEETDISYYDPDWSGSGDIDYRRERCKLDVYYPTHITDFSTIVYFHGGGLLEGEKGFHDALGNQNVAIVTPNYRLSSARARCPDYLEDAAAAVAWAFRNIDRYGGNPAKIYVSGASAGGYLAAMIGMAPSYLARHDISTMKIAGIMSVSGQMTTHFQVVNERNGVFSYNYDPVPVIDEFAPIFYLHKDIPPMLLLTGDPAHDMPGRAEENRLLASLLTRSVGHPGVECINLAGFDHGDIYNPACLLILKKIKELEKHP